MARRGGGRSPSLQGSEGAASGARPAAAAIPPCEMQTLRMLCAGAPLVATDTGHRYGEEEGKGDAWVCAAEGWLGPWECIRSRLCLVCWASEGIM